MQGVNSTRLLVRLSGEYTQKCFYAKRMVSKRVYETLKREKVDWDSLKTPQLFMDLCKPPDNRPVDTLKPKIAKTIEGIEQYLSPNLGSPQSIDEEIKKSENMENDLMELIDKIKYHEVGNPAAAAAEEPAVDRYNNKKKKAPSARQIITQILNDSLDSDRQYQQQHHQVNRNNGANSTAENDTWVSLRDIDPEESNHPLNDNLSLVERMSIAKISTASDSINTSTKKSKPRFYYQAGEGSPLFNFSAYQLEEINKLEQKSIELQKEREEYASLNKSKSDFIKDMKNLKDN
ncbi:hypothetical protein CYY_004504 [Polysphondylium violaceum]|uniref:Uncharacterized protein n=1 Tax=Polysphondylium violaceum TaxID=133409 RepID=A0A8J4Q585_9MYCE|nr:hypothetical protein CYY_004504 [Polysphondylium violaceum]